jgi:hypothetical protein
VWWKNSRIFKNFLNTFVQIISRIFQNKHQISSHPRGQVWLMLSHLHPKGMCSSSNTYGPMEVKKMKEHFQNSWIIVIVFGKRSGWKCCHYCQYPNNLFCFGTNLIYKFTTSVRLTQQFCLFILWQNWPLHFLWQNRPLYISNGAAQG